MNQSGRQEFEEIRNGIAPLMCDENEGEVADSIQNFWTPQLDYLECASKRALYHSIEITKETQSLQMVRGHV